MQQPTYHDQSYQFFIEEADELLESIETGLLTLREENSLGKVHEIMRAAHSIKGGAASVGLDGIQFLAHRLEDFFKAFYNESLIIDVELEGLLLQGFDCLKNPLIEQIKTGAYDAQSALEKANPIFEKLELRLKPFLEGQEDFLPSSADLGIDLAVSIFEVDVKQGLDDLTTVLATPDRNIATQLLSTMEMFIGFAQLLSLPGFQEIATTVKKALELHPDKAVDITKVALENFQIASSQVLEGDRILGGKVEPALLAYLAEIPAPVASISQEEEDKTELAEKPEKESFVAQNDGKDFQDQAYRFFIEEARDLLQVIETELLTLRTEKNRSKVHQIMRAAHSIKGGAASVGLEAIRTIAHRLEDFFKALYGDKIEVNEELEGLLLEGFDSLRNPLIEQIETGFHDPELALARAYPIFEKVANLLGDILKETEQYVPNATDSGVDIAASIFETDVPEELERLQLVIADPQNYEVAGELRATAEVLGGFAQLLDLPGLEAIATTIIKALERHPYQAVELTKVALTNFLMAREQVLAGDRKLGGSPSEELLAYVKEEIGTLSLSELFVEEIEEKHPLIETDLNSLSDDIQQQAYQFFIEEAVELLQGIEEGLNCLALEKSKPKVHEIMRAAHSIKGGAASAGLETIRSLAYRLEKIFKALYYDEVILDQELMGWLKSGFESLRDPLLQQIESGGFDEPKALETSEPIFAHLEVLLADALNREEEYIPTSEDLGVDIASSIFELDVQQELDKLTQVLGNGSDSDITEQLGATAQMLAGFAELFNLPGLGQMTATVLSAVEVHAQRVREIAEIALRDFTDARQLVLDGDRSSGGNPSPELLAFGENASEFLDTPSLDEVFSFNEQTPSTNGILNNNLVSFNHHIEENLTPSSSLSLDEIFGASDINSQESLEVIEGLTPTLDDVFGPVETKPERELPAPSLDDVFGSVQEEAQKELSPPSLDDVFGAVTATPEKELTPPSLDEVFGSEEKIEATQTHLTPEKLEDLVSLVEKDFDKLPSINEQELSSSLAKIAETKQAPKPSEVKPSLPTVNQTVRHSPTKQVSGAETAKAEAALSVRVDFNRLERMNNLVGELAINRNSLSLQNNQLQSAVKELLNRFSRFHLIGNKLRELSDLMLVDASMRGRSINSVPQWSANSKLFSEEESILGDKSDFDTLEMDRYGSVYSLLQSILEEMLQLEESVDDIVLFARGSDQTLEQQRQMLTSLRDELMWARMLPLGEVLNRFPRVLRDLSTTYHKPVRLKLVGTGVLVDRAALEKLYDPLLHLLRNAFDHGIEPPQDRQKRGKSEEGQIEIRAYHQGNQTIIEIKDDGNGLNLEKIRMTALKTGIVTPEQLAVMSNEEVAELIFEPGFSTASKVSELSGRGVGLDVVRSQIQNLKGTVTVSSHPGEGTTFALKLPLTMTIAKLLVCLMNAKTHDGGVGAIALPSDSIEEIIIPEPQQIKKSGEQRFLYWQEQIIPIYPVSDLLEYRCSMPKTFSSKVLDAVPMPSDWGLPLLLLRRGQQVFALEVDRLVTEQELVIKPFGSCVAPPTYTYGCTILGDGTLIPVINGIMLLEQYLGLTSVTSNSNSEESKSETMMNTSIGMSQTSSIQTSTILVVDDSAALRRTLALTLQKAGYRVMQAKDGREALQQLQQNSNVQLVVCDVEMPNMNGFEFLGQRRRYPELMNIPVAMLTSRSSEKHRQLATHLGASAYFTKPYIEQQFLTAVDNIVKSK
ncbi:Hpt domain-containing protein [Gloeothece citriformis]|nr:Hpt domain-containing protein [Gloeothece citriformis]